MDFVKELAAFLDWFAMGGVSDGGKITDCGGEFAGVKEVCIEGRGGHMFLIAESAAPKDAVEFERVELSPGFTG